MAIPKFFHKTDTFIVGDTISLSDDEVRHASMSRRLQTGSEVILLNGHGWRATGKFVQLSKRVGTVFIEEVVRLDRPVKKVTLACAIPKGDRQKVMFDMLTQCGVSDFIPLHCEFSVVKASTKLIEKWQRIIIEACKQSGNEFTMQVHQPKSVAELVTELIDSDIWCESQLFRAELDDNRSPTVTHDNVLTLIGPEGGFSQTEKELLDSSGVETISFSDHILRTETAAVAAAVKLLNA